MAQCVIVFCVGVLQYKVMPPVRKLFDAPRKAKHRTSNNRSLKMMWSTQKAVQRACERGSSSTSLPSIPEDDIAPTIPIENPVHVPEGVALSSMTPSHCAADTSNCRRSTSELIVPIELPEGIVTADEARLYNEYFIAYYELSPRTAHWLRDTTEAIIATT